MEWIVGIIILAGVSAVLIRTFHLVFKESRGFSRETVTECELVEVIHSETTYGPLTRAVFVIANDSETIVVPEHFAAHVQLPMKGILKRRDGAFIGFIPRP